MGIILDSGLSWSKHINHLSKKVAKATGILSRARQIFNRDTLVQLYYSFVYPFLTYCSIIWGNAPKVYTSQIFKIQKRAIRTICNIRKRNSTLNACHKLRILRFPDIYKYSALLFMHKYKHGNLPNSFNVFFTENRAFHNYQTRGANNLIPPKVKTKTAQTFIKKTGADLWNEFATILSHTNSIGLFKRELITHLTQQYNTTM